MRFVNPRWSMVSSLALCCAYRLHNTFNGTLSREAAENNTLAEVALTFRSARTLPDTGAFQVTHDLVGSRALTLALPSIENSSLLLQTVALSSGARQKQADGHYRSRCTYKTVLRRSEAFISLCIFGSACFLLVVSCMKLDTTDCARHNSSSMPLALRVLLTLAVASSVLVVIRVVSDAFAPSLFLREALAQDASDAVRHVFMFFAEWKKGSLSSDAEKEFAAKVDVFSMMLALTTVVLSSMDVMWQAVFRLTRFSRSSVRVSADESCPLLVSTVMSIVVHVILLLTICYLIAFKSVPDESTSTHTGNAQRSDVSAGSNPLSQSQPIRDHSNQQRASSSAQAAGAPAEAEANTTTLPGSSRASSSNEAVAERATKEEEYVNLNLRAAILDLTTDFVEDIVMLIDGMLTMSGKSPELVDSVCGIVFGVILLIGSLALLPGVLQRWQSLRRCTSNANAAG